MSRWTLNWQDLRSKIPYVASFLIGSIFATAIVYSFFERFRCIIEYRMTEARIQIIIGFVGVVAAVIIYILPRNIQRVLGGLYGGVALVIIVSVLIDASLPQIESEKCPQQPTSTPTPTITPIQTPTPTVTSTPTPTVTSTPTPTVTSTPTLYFKETFAPIENLDQRWNIFDNGGQLVSLSPGIRLEQGRTNKYPYLISRTNPFPTTGDFDVEISLRYNDVTYYGTGVALSICCQANAQVPSASESKTLVALWQDINDGIRVERWNYSSNRDPFYFWGRGTTSQELQQVLIQYQSDDNLLTVSINGEEILTMQAAQRPDRIWLGNPFLGDSPWEWSTLEVISILVFGR